MYLDFGFHGQWNLGILQMLASGDITYVLSPGETPARWCGLLCCATDQIPLHLPDSFKYSTEILRNLPCNVSKKFFCLIYTVCAHKPMSKTQMRHNDAKASICSCYNLFPFVPKQCCCCIYLKTTVPLFIMKQKTGHLIKCKLILAVGACVSFVLTNKI